MAREPELAPWTALENEYMDLYLYFQVLQLFLLHQSN